jgi:hypothetical protein
MDALRKGGKKVTANSAVGDQFEDGEHPGDHSSLLLSSYRWDH